MNETDQYRMFLVEDEAGLRILGKISLQSLGVCEAFGTPIPALEALRQRVKARQIQDFPDIIITDNKMPEMSGEEFASIVRQEFPGLPIVMLSGDLHNEGFAERVQASGNVDLLLGKPYSPGNLVQIIGEVLPRGRAWKLAFFNQPA